MTHALSNDGKKQPLYVKIIVGIAALILGLIALVTIVEKLGGASKSTGAKQLVAQSEEPPAAIAPEPFPIEVADVSSDEISIVTATYPVADAFTHDGVIRNIQDGCVEALKEIQAKTEAWWDYDTLQCSALSNWSEQHVQVGSANFSGAQLAEVSLTDVDPVALWEQGDSFIAPEFR